MDLFSIGFTDAMFEFKYKFNLIREELKSKGYFVRVDEVERGDYCFLTYHFMGKDLPFKLYETVRAQLQSYITEALLDYYIRSESKKLVRKIIGETYDYFGEKERKKIYDYAVKLLVNAEYTKEYREAVREKLNAYLSLYPELIIDGFKRFRLKNYAAFIEAVVEEAAENYVNEVEYQEFIQVLKYFVSTNTPQVEVVQILLSADEIPVLLDQQGEKLSYQYVDFVERKSREAHEELLVTTLINISPRQIILHRRDVAAEDAFIGTLTSIFPDRIEICGGCDLCDT